MNAQELLFFLENEMRMSHVYQPLLIRCLLNRGGSALIQDLAEDFSLGVEKDFKHYKKQIVKNPLPVLQSHGVVSHRDDQIRLNLEPCSDAEVQTLVTTCGERIDDFLERKGVDTWDDLRDNTFESSHESPPGLDDLLLPTLHALRHLGGKAHIREIEDHIIEQLELPQNLLEIPTPASSNDTRTTFVRDATWARTKLKTLGHIVLADGPRGHGVWILTDSDNSTAEDALASSEFENYGKDVEEQPFDLFNSEQRKVESSQKSYARSANFRFDVLARYGTKCALCSIDESVLLEAAHIVPKADNGSDDPRNGLPLCLLHHKATEKNVALIRIHPETLEVICTGGRTYEELKVTKSSLEGLPNLPSKEALEYLWKASGAYLGDQ